MVVVTGIALKEGTFKVHLKNVRKEPEKDT